MTGQPLDEVVVQHAKSLLKEYRALSLEGSMAAEVWEEVSNLFSEHQISHWTAAQFFVCQAAEAVPGSDNPPTDTCYILQARSSL